MKVAVVHDWLVTFTGAEKVLEQILNVFPSADLFAVCDHLVGSGRDFLDGRAVTTSFIQNMPLSRRYYRTYLPLMPLAIEQFDLSPYELVISSSHSVAKGVITGPNQLHISYVHTPIRYAWDLQHQYLQESGLTVGARSWLARWILHNIRIWDTRTANGVDHFIANSRFIAKRINKTYRRHSEVIYPPVDTSKFTLGDQREKFYLAASRLVPYKRMDVIIQAFNRIPDRTLVIIGDGPDLAKLKRLAGPNVHLLGFQADDILVSYMKSARAFLFAAEEDFGIMPVEAQACGTPVIAFGRGGALETVRGLESSSPTGVFFPEQSIESVVAAIREFEGSEDRFSTREIRCHALSFSEERFRREFQDLVSSVLNNWRIGRA